MASAASAAAFLGFGDAAMAFCCSGGRSAALAASCTPIRPLFTASCNSGSPFSLTLRVAAIMAWLTTPPAALASLRLDEVFGSVILITRPRARRRLFAGGRFGQPVVQVKIFGGDQSVCDTLLGQVRRLMLCETTKIKASSRPPPKWT